MEAITKSTYPLSCALNDVSRDAGLLQFIRSLSFNRLGESLNVLPLLESQNQDQKLINVVNELVSSNFAKHNSEYSLLVSFINFKYRIFQFTDNFQLAY